MSLWANRTSSSSLEQRQQHLMPPPHKVYRTGTDEYQVAMETGAIQLSLPEFAPPREEEVTNDGEAEVGEAAAAVDGILDSDEPLQPQKYPFARISAEVHDVDEDEDNDDAMQEEEGCDRHQSNLNMAVVVNEESSNGGNSSNNNSDNNNHDVNSGRNEKRKLEYRQPDSSLPRFCDIVGHGAVKLRIQEVLLPIALPTKLANSILTGVRSMPASILLSGPPGVGKTKLARAIAGEAEAAFLSVGPSDILSKYVGESEAAVRDLFVKAQEQAAQMESKCAILFLDEIDALGQSRGSGSGGEQSQGGGGDSCSRRVLAELLIQFSKLANPSPPSEVEESTDSNLDQNEEEDESYDPCNDNSMGMQTGTESNEHERSRASSAEDQDVRVIVVAATNRPSDCDPALTRRFGVRVHVGLPTMRDRLRILKHLLKNIAHSINRTELRDLAVALEGWSGSELESLAREATMAPVRECIRVAARKKRRTGRGLEQRGGDYSGQNDDDSGRAQAIRAFEALRSVTLADFEAAIEFWSGNQEAYNSSCSNAMVGDGGKFPTVHYDSSSSSDDDSD